MEPTIIISIITSIIVISIFGWIYKKKEDEKRKRLQEEEERKQKEFERWRKVCLGQCRLSENFSIGYHWGVQVGNRLHKDKLYWFEVDGKTRFTHLNTTTSIVASQGSKSVKGTQPTKEMGLTDKSDQEIDRFNKQWMEEHPGYSILSDNCQKYATELVEYLCPDAVKDLPPQEGPIVKAQLKTVLKYYLLLSFIFMAYYFLEEIWHGLYNTSDYFLRVYKWLSFI